MHGLKYKNISFLHGRGEKLNTEIKNHSFYNRNKILNNMFDKKNKDCKEENKQVAQDILLVTHGTGKCRKRRIL